MNTQIGKCKIIEHSINVDGAKPIREGLRKYSMDQKEEISRQVQDLLQAGAIEN